MFSKITVAFSLLFATRLALAGSSPPPCLLAAIKLVVVLNEVLQILTVMQYPA